MTCKVCDGRIQRIAKTEYMWKKSVFWPRQLASIIVLKYLLYM